MKAYSKLIIVLARIIEADFKSVKKKFLAQEIEEEEIDEYIKDFKKLKDGNRITKTEQKNIDNWGNKSFNEFREFIDELKSNMSKTQEKKLKKMEGAELRAENEDWYAYKITTHDAVMFYGSGTKWCITEPNGKHWNTYNTDNDFYFFISKNRAKDDPWYKIALQIDIDDDKLYWDAPDKEHDEDDIGNEDLNLPSFDVDIVEESVDIEKIKRHIKTLIDDEMNYPKDEDYAESYLPYNPDQWYFDNLSDNILNLLSKVKSLLGVKNETDNNWIEFIQSIANIERNDDNNEPNAISSFGPEEIEVTFEYELIDQVEKLSDEEYEDILDQVLKGTNRSSVDTKGFMMEVPHNWSYSIDEKALKETVTELEFEDNWKNKEPTQEELAQIFSHPSISFGFKKDILRKIHDDNILKDLYLKSKNKNISEQLIHSIDNIEVIKEIFLKESGYAIRELFRSSWPLLLRKLKDEKQFLGDFFKDPSKPKDIKYYMVGSGHITDQNLIAAFLRSELEDPLAMDSGINELVNKLNAKSHQELLKKVHEEMPTTYHSRVIENIDDKEWLLEEFSKAYKHKKSHPDDPLTRYYQLIMKLVELVKTDDSLRQYLFEQFPELPYNTKFKLIGTSDNKEWLKKVIEAFEGDEEYGDYSHAAKRRLGDLEKGFI